MDIREVLSLAQRRKRKHTMRRAKAKIKRGQKMAKRRRANPERIKKRAARQARTMVKKQLSKGNYSSMSSAQKMSVDKRAERKQGRIKKLARKLRPKVRQKERQRFKSKKESIDVDDLNSIVEQIELEMIGMKIEENLKKKAKKNGISFEEIKQRFLALKAEYQPVTTKQNEDQVVFESLNTGLAHQKDHIREAIETHVEQEIPLHQTWFKPSTMNFFRLFSEARKQYRESELTLTDPFDIFLMEKTDLGEFERIDNAIVPLDLPKLSESHDKYMVYTRDGDDVKTIEFHESDGNDEGEDIKEAKHFWANRLSNYNTMGVEE